MIIKLQRLMIDSLSNKLIVPTISRHGDRTPTSSGEGLIWQKALMVTNPCPNLNRFKFLRANRTKAVGMNPSRVLIKVISVLL
ncbi:MAG: hypothetical protein ACHQYP_00355 [Nitrospiria bacterium]